MTTYTSHPYTHPVDYPELYRLLAESNAQTGAPRNWTFARLENWRYASWDVADEAFGRMAHLWRDANGRLAAFAIVEHEGDPVNFQIRPDCRAVEPLMLDWAETRFGGEREVLEVIGWADDPQRASLLTARGYHDAGPEENLRAYDTAAPRPPVALPPGYRLSDMAEFGDAAAYCELERRAFNNDYIDLRWFRGKTSAPRYDPRLHVIVLSPDGRPVSVAHGWADRATRTAEIDPVATHPDHQRRRLAHAAVLEAFARLAAIDVPVAWISSAADPWYTNRLYEALQPAHKWTMHRWKLGIRN